MPHSPLRVSHTSTTMVLFSVLLGVVGCADGLTALLDGGAADTTSDTASDTTSDTDGDAPVDSGADQSDDVDRDSTDIASDQNPDVDDDQGNDVTDVDPDAPTDCDPGEWCNPFRILTLPYTDNRDTSDSPWSDNDSYSCSPGTDEAGPEYYYVVEIPDVGILSAVVSDGAGVDIDVHLLSDVAPSTCLSRNDTRVDHLVEAGTYYIVADTWVNNSDVALTGEYTLRVSWQPLGIGNCAIDVQDLEMFWGECDGTLDCYESAGDVYLRTPALGPVVKEAHLVTTGESFPSTWPSSTRDEIERHYTLSEDATGYEMSRTEPWAPAGEGGSMWGQGATGAKIPLVAEAWYVNMYWRQRPAPGTRLILVNPSNGRAVVAAGGYETGPGANTSIGGASEEIHDHLGTSHRDLLIIGFAENQTLDYGPIDCDF